MKAILYPVLNEHTYKYFQALSKAWDIRSGKWAEPELDLLPLAVREGETALDVGANYGLYSYHLDGVVGTAGRVYAFEPVPFTHETLVVVARLLRLRRVEVFDKGCSDRAGKIAFTVPVQASGAMAAGQAYIGARNDEREGREGQVRWTGTRDVVCEVVALDEFLPRVEKLSLIKCDIEGAELLAFRGAERMIDAHLPSVICEINPWFLEGFGIKLEELTTFFFDKGYELYHYRRGDGGGGRLRRVGLEEVIEDNYTFIHPSRRERFAPVLAQS
ncbi:MAG TPA: FkbM family methyltransferase [Pyrinomonadaceae bacterium]|nr:FkbM family methyltransferase [Pyrinomonadaceae bacterium]